jgi:hypothetical protein
MPQRQEEEIEGASSSISDALFVTEIRRLENHPQRVPTTRCPYLPSAERIYTTKEEEDSQSL